MKRMMILAAAAVGILAFVEVASAAGPGPRAAGVVEPAGHYGPVANSGGRYGLHPLFSRGSRGLKSAGCDTCGDARGGARGCGAGGCGAPSPYAGAPGYPGGPMPGTLAFPVNPYIRSPRDFFMVQPR